MLPSSSPSTTTLLPPTIIRWGILGCGDVVEVKSGPAFYKIPGSHLVAVMRRNAASAESFAQRHHVPSFYSDAQELLDDREVDAVYVATPPGNHKDLALLCAKAGKPTLVEKPMARSAVECREMIRGFNRASLPLFVAYYRRHLPKFETVHAILEGGRLGKVTEVRLFCSRLRPVPKEGGREGWRVDAGVAGGGLFLDLGSHMLDLVDWWFGQLPLESVQGLAGRSGSSSSSSSRSSSSSSSSSRSSSAVPSSSPSFSSSLSSSSFSAATEKETAADVEDQVRMVFKTKDGALGIGTWNFASFLEEDYIHIIGEEGHVKFSVFNHEPLILTTGKEGEEGGEEKMRVEEIGGFAVGASPHVHLPLIAAVTEDVRRWKESRATAAAAAAAAGGGRGGGGNTDGGGGVEKEKKKEEGKGEEEIEWQCRSTGASALRTSEVMDKVLADYYGGTRDDAFWTRPETWNMP